MEDTHLYREIVSSLTDGIVVLDLDGTIRFANASAEELLGASPLRGRHFDEFLDLAGRRHSHQHLTRAARGELLDDEVDTMLIRLDGSSLWVRLRQAGLRDDAGVSGVILRLTDNHETRRLLEEAFESRRGLMRAERIARSGSWTWHVATQTTSHSEGLEQLYGEHVTDLLSADRERLQALTHPEDHLRLFEALEQLGNGRRPRVDLELRQRGRHGWMWVRLRAWGSYDPTGALVEVSGTYQDITRARDTEDQLQDLVTQNSLMNAVATAANEATSLDDVLSQAASMVVLHDDWDRARAFVPSPDGSGLVEHPDSGVVGTDGEDAAIDTIERATADECYRLGHSVWDPERRLTLASPVRLDGEILAVVVITSLPPLYRHDMIQQMVEQSAVLISRVAEREGSRRELAAARDRAVETSQHKSDFLTTMSHEIRTPLNGIIGLNELLGSTSLSERQRHFVSGIALSSRALLDLLNDILDFSKIEAGRLEVEAVDFEVRELLAEVGDMLVDSTRGRDIVLRVSSSDDVPDLLCGDPTRLRQVLLNFGSNALKFTTAGSVSIRATAVPRPDDAGVVLRFDVSDTGMGITAEQREHIFAPFAQADASTTRRFGGTGLGLAICAEIVAAFGGEIGVDSEPGAGSTFWFTAPLGPATGRPAQDALAEARLALGGLRVLVVDDDDDNRTLLLEQLAWWDVDAQAVPADVGSDVGSEVGSDASYDAVLLGSDLAEPTGHALAEAVRRGHHPAGLPVVLVTSSYVAVDDELRRAGVVACLARPVSSATLRDALLLVLSGEQIVELGAGLSSTEVAGAGDRGHVLVVEDNHINQLVARGFLEAQGFAVITADDGRAALALLEHQEVDVVLMDVQMPGLDGYETTQALRRWEAATHRERLPVIALTAAAVSGERERCLAAGMDDFLTKPVSSAALRSALTRWVGPDLVRRPGGRPGGRPRARGPLSPHLDLDRLAELLEMGPGADAYLDRAIDNFLRRRPDVIAGLTRAVEQDDATALRAAAHSLKGSASNLGLPTVAAIAGRLEGLGDQGTTQGAMTAVAELAAALAEAATVLVDYRAWREQTADTAL
ncbi:PAS domain-containing hybrid sensor histidine kinase/response regulator [Nocardioides plantarum]|uniref:histidine kinase n=1 Tax=Nocardioides plantarum TaxID=29299 RepID=A0ABV5KEQ0_9ACTN|nr:PAS domain-containing hybrid sensor histidine kinase/response regulator [Nocardioides plantarum]